MKSEQGTNYIMVHPQYGEVVIGKGTVGWHFGLNIYPEAGIMDLEDWQEILKEKGVTIKEENGTAVSYDELMKIITDRKAPEDELYMDQLRKDNSEWSEPGLNGLLAHRSFIINFSKMKSDLRKDWPPLIVTWVRTKGCYDLIPTKISDSENTH